MTSETPPAIRKRLIGEESFQAVRREPSHHNELAVFECATVHFSSEDPAHPLENLFDGSAGSGASYWASARPDTTEVLLLEFDNPQRIAHITFEVEEHRLERTQEVRAEYSTDGGVTFQYAFIQEYTFSPRGATYECEGLSVDLRDVTHLRLTIVPDKSGSGTACLTSVRLFS